MNEFLIATGLITWKPLLGILVLPPVPLLLLVLLGAACLRRRPWLGWLGVLGGCLGLWLMGTGAVAGALNARLDSQHPTLGPAQIHALSQSPKTAIIVLGSGRILLAPEYGRADLKPMTHERLRYGLWLAQKTGLPVGYSGGLSYGSEPGPSEAEIAASVAEQVYRQPLRWTESRSRDTNENAIRTLELLAPQGITHIVVVTHGFHMPRAIAAFERAKLRANSKVVIQAAPMGLKVRQALSAGDWLPTRGGYVGTLLALHEMLGRWMGA
nr:YdcF family protein [uncultured Roseateles sp.]